jgi:HTH-type transcriptional repressor of NAD biosynthesis genes
MIKAFIFGKFLPLHKGHEAMIRFALTKCDFLTVLVCCSDKEELTDTIRKTWVETSFKNYKNIEVKTFNYREDELPNTSVSSKDVSKIWSQTFKKLFPDYSLVITSEKYGDYVADYMGIQHISFDIPKQLFPISATDIRKDLFTYWKYLADSSKPYFSIKVVVLGTESTGKTTLTQRLTKHYNCSLVSEVGREFIANSNSFLFDNLRSVAIEHAKRINSAVLGESPLVIIDTDIHITQSYSEFVFGKPLLVENHVYADNKAHLYLYLTNDVAFVQDGTRLNETNRNLLDVSHRKVLQRSGVDFLEINGNWDERFKHAVTAIDQLIKKN